MEISEIDKKFRTIKIAIVATGISIIGATALLCWFMEMSQRIRILEVICK